MANKYWVGGSGTWTDTGTGHWADTSGGLPIASAPAAGDNVFFNSASSAVSYAVTQDATVTNIYQFANVTFDAPGSGTLSYTCNNYLFISGNVTIAASGVSLTDMLLYFGGTSTLTTNGVAVKEVYLDSGTSLTLGGALTSTSVVTIFSGTFNTANNNVTTGQFNSPNSGGAAATLTLGSSTITVTGSTVNMAHPSLTVTASTATISMTSASSKTFTGGGRSWYKLDNGGAGTLSVAGSNTFNTISNTVQPCTFSFTSGTTQTVTNFDVSGTSGNLVTIQSSTSGSAATLSKASGTVSRDYLSIQDSTATGGATWYAGANSTNVSGNTGWVFTSAPSTSTGFLGFLLRT